MLPSLIVIDDFLRDPLTFRAQALALDYDPAFKKGNYPGLLSTRPLPITGLDDAVSSRTGVRLQPAAGTTRTSIVA